MISFDYKRWYKPGEIKNYENVKPYKIIIFDGFFYLLVQYKDYYIKFYLNEINNLKITNQTFQHDGKLIERMNKALNIWFDPTAEPYDVILLLESDAIVYFERKPIKGQYLKKNSDGTAELTVSITDKREIFALLKRWLPQIKVIEPSALQDEFEDMLRGYLSSSIYSIFI